MNRNLKRFPSFYCESNSQEADVRTCSSLSWSEDIFEKETSQKMEQMLENVDEVIYNSSHQQGMKPDVLEECKNWGSAFPNLRICGNALSNDAFILKDTSSLFTKSSKKNELPISSSFEDISDCEGACLEDKLSNKWQNSSEREDKEMAEKVIDFLTIKIWPEVLSWLHKDQSNYDSEYKGCQRLPANLTKAPLTPTCANENVDLDGILTVSAKVLQKRKESLTSNPPSTRVSSLNKEQPTSLINLDKTSWSSQSQIFVTNDTPSSKKNLLQKSQTFHELSSALSVSSRNELPVNSRGKRIQESFFLPSLDFQKVHVPKHNVDFRNLSQPISQSSQRSLVHFPEIFPQSSHSESPDIFPIIKALSPERRLSSKVNAPTRIRSTGKASTLIKRRV